MKSDSPPAPSPESETLEFKWGQKRGKGGKKRDIQFYQSFTLRGVDYSLFDNVYVKNDFAEPRIGKIIKIWETPTLERKIKVQWFFRPSEVSKCLTWIKIYFNELFFACGDGDGLATIHPLVIHPFILFFVCIKEVECHRVSFRSMQFSACLD